MSVHHVAIRGDLVTTPTFGEISVLPDHLLIAESAEQGGAILAVVPGYQEADACVELGLDTNVIVRLKVISTHSILT